MPSFQRTLFPLDRPAGRELPLCGCGDPQCPVSRIARKWRRQDAARHFRREHFRRAGTDGANALENPPADAIQTITKGN